MEKQKDRVLMKNNVMVKAKYDLNANENKVFQLILYKFQKKNDDTLFAEIPKSEFEELLKSPTSKTEKAISNVLLKLRKGDIWIITETGWNNYGFINTFGYDKLKNTFTIEGSKVLYDLLMNYLNGYTPINMSIFFSFKSYHSQRFYEFLRLWSNTKQIINYSLDELKELLMLENKYPEYKDFKKRVINPTIKELNEKSLMQVDFKENKINRKVVSIDFIVKDNDKRKYFQDKQQDKSNNKKSNDNKSYQYDNKKTLRFNDYEQREYDYDALEKKLLGWDTED